MNKSSIKKHKLEFIIDFKKEFWFIENKYEEAKKSIGEERFGYIINQNIPNIYNKDKKIFHKNLKKYIENNKNDIALKIKKKSKIIEKEWKKFEKEFFQQIESITQIKWKHKIYKVFLLYSCFWGGDYDINQQNIYINPLLEHGDPLYVIFHELVHLIYWEYIFSKYSNKFIKKNEKILWQISEIMVNCPLLKLKINFKFSLVIPKDLEKMSSNLIKKFHSENFTEIIDNQIKKKAEL